LSPRAAEALAASSASFPPPFPIHWGECELPLLTSCALRGFMPSAAPMLCNLSRGFCHSSPPSSIQLSPFLTHGVSQEPWGIIGLQKSRNWVKVHGLCTGGTGLRRAKLHSEGTGVFPIAADKKVVHTNPVGCVRLNCQTIWGWAQWLTLVILATWEAEIGRSAVWAWAKS
jgi:hypothetical protein